MTIHRVPLHTNLDEPIGKSLQQSWYRLPEFVKVNDGERDRYFQLAGKLGAYHYVEIDVYDTTDQAEVVDSEGVE